MDSYGPSIFCSTVDDSVKNELTRRSVCYTSQNVATSLFDWTTNKTAYVTATATVEANNSVISTATLDNNKELGGLFAINDNKHIYKRYAVDIQSGDTSIASFLPQPIIKSAHIGSYGDIGQLYECHIEFTLFSHTDLSNYTPFFEIGGKLNVKYGWTKVGGACNKASFEGVITNFSYTLSHDGSYECSTDALGPGSNILVSNINSDSQTADTNTISTEDGKGDEKSAYIGIGSDIIKRIHTVGTTAPQQLQQNGILYLPGVNKFNSNNNTKSDTTTKSQNSDELVDPHRVSLNTDSDVYLLKHLTPRAVNELALSYCKTIDFPNKQNGKNAKSYNVHISEYDKDKLIDLTTYYFALPEFNITYTDSANAGQVLFDDVECAFGSKGTDGFINQTLKQGTVLFAVYDNNGKFKKAHEFTNPTLKQLADEGLIKIGCVYDWMNGHRSEKVRSLLGNINVISSYVSFDANTNEIKFNTKSILQSGTGAITLDGYTLNSLSHHVNTDTHSTLRVVDFWGLYSQLYDQWFIQQGKIKYDISKFTQDTINMLSNANVDVYDSYFNLEPANNYYIQFKHIIEILNLTILYDKKNRIYFDSPKNNQCFETNESFNNNNNSNSNITYTVIDNTLPSDGCLVYFSDVKDDNNNSDLRAADGTIVFASPDPKTLIYPNPFATYRDIDLNCKSGASWGDANGSLDGYKSLSDIFFNCDYILTLLQSIGTPEINSVDTTIRSDIMAFLKNLFNVINTNSGGRFRLDIRQDLKNKNYLVIYCLDTVYHDNDTNVKIYQIQGVSNGSYLRSANISSDIPDSVASMVGIQNSNGQFIMSNNTTAGAVGRLFFNGITGKRIEASAEIEAKEEKIKTRQNAIHAFNNAFSQLQLNTSSDDESDNAAYYNFTNTMRSAITTLYQSDMFQHYPALIPVHFTFTLDGIYGFKFGDCISFNYVPDLYKPSNHVFFNVIKINHRIQDNDWVTEIDTILRYLPNTKCIVTATHVARPYTKVSSIASNQYASNINAVNLDEFLTDTGKLTTHFKPEDLLKTSYATIAQNTPSESDAENIRRLIPILDAIASYAEQNGLGKVYIGSGYRNEYVNKKAGGVSKSQHRKGEAADLTLSNKKNNGKLFNLILKLCHDGIIEFDQLLWEFGVKNKYPDWVHISYKSDGSAPNRRQVLRIHSNGCDVIYAHYK